MTIIKSRLPNAPLEYNDSWGNALVRAIDQTAGDTITALENINSTPGYFGSFFSNQTQTAAATSTPYAVTLNNTYRANQVGVVSNSRITVKNRGTYNLQFSVQVQQTVGGDHFVWIWFRRNGVNIADSTGKFAIQGNKGELIPSWNFIIDLKASDYVEVMWAVENTGIRLLNEPSTAFCPAIPSAIVTIVSI